MKKKALSDHKQIGKKFIPKFFSGITEVQYSERLLPEIAWVGYFMHVLGLARGLPAVFEFGKVCWGQKLKGEFKGFPLISSFRGFSIDDWAQVVNCLKIKNVYEDCCEALLPFLRCYPEKNPFKGLMQLKICPNPTDEDVRLASFVVEGLFYRRSQEASIAQAAVHAMRLETGTMHYSPEVPAPDLNAILEKFGSPEADRACAHVRMELNMLAMYFKEEIPIEWAHYFWNNGKVLIPIMTEFDILPLPTGPKIHPLQKFANEFENHSQTNLREIWAKLPIDIFESETYEVIGALLSRQCTLAIRLARNPDICDWHIGPILLRAMTDTYITIAWILKDPLNRARKFISYGLGQEKLRIEHLKIEREKVGNDAEKKKFDKFIEERESWVNAQHYTFLQEVDVGSWSGISTRDMAKEADCMDLYRFAYTPLSNAAHSAWNHIGMFDSVPSSEPLHKHIQQPFFIEWGSTFDVVVDAARYLDMTFAQVQEKFRLTLECQGPYEWLLEKIEDLRGPKEDAPLT